ncbi:hypothetical protein IHE45_05G109800 [Dioscorea alata]|uniref:Uncharacterized protein n=1 Tax=Dioscorea alata TaxID=55571 RepID=A0ACB7W4A7_DIOAL|nr:hypothetical protein IHE45_05G109800 [Dioscorea alata]
MFKENIFCKLSKYNAQKYLKDKTAMNLTKISLQMPCISPSITTSSILTLHGRNTCLSSKPPHPRLRFSYRLPSAMTSMRTRNDHKFHQVICNASFQDNEISGNFDEEFKYEEMMIIRAALASYMISDTSSKLLEQMVENGINRKRDKSLQESHAELDCLIQMAEIIRMLQEASTGDLADIRAKSGKYVSVLKEVDKLIEKEEYEEAEKICDTLEKDQASELDSGLVLRQFIALLGQGKTHLTQYIKETKSLQHLGRQHKLMDHLIHKSIRGFFNEFKFIRKMLRAKEKLEEYEENVKDLTNTTQSDDDNKDEHKTTPDEQQVKEENHGN